MEIYYGQTNMIKFKQYLLEQVMGNYVCIDCEDLSKHWLNVGLTEPTTGKSPPEGDYHCTLIYSKDTKKDPKKIMNALKSWENFQNDEKCVVESYDCFDSTPEKGSRDAAKSCVVMKLDSAYLHACNEFLKSQGLMHSYPQFSPHVTLRYNMSVEEAHFYKDKLNNLNKQIIVNLKDYKSEPINTNYV